MNFYSEKHYGCSDFATFFAAIAILQRDKPRAVCQLLDVTPATLQNYLSGKSTPPKAAVRLLFMESYYGASAVSTHTANALTLQYQIVETLKGQLDAMRATLDALELENDALKRSGDAQDDHAANSARWRA